jgi:hypothetical protein
MDGGHDLAPERFEVEVPDARGARNLGGRLVGSRRR